MIDSPQTAHLALLPLAWVALEQRLSTSMPRTLTLASVELESEGWNHLNTSSPLIFARVLLDQRSLDWKHEETSAKISGSLRTFYADGQVITLPNANLPETVWLNNLGHKFSTHRFDCHSTKSPMRRKMRVFTNYSSTFTQCFHMHPQGASKSRILGINSPFCM